MSTHDTPPERTDPRSGSDGELVARVRAGETDAYAILVRRYTAIAHRTAVLLGAGAEVDDVVQEAFVQAYRSLDRFRPDERSPAPFRPWLLRIVTNLTHNHHRGRVRRVAREHAADALILHPTDRVDPADIAVRDSTRERLLAAVRTLPTHQRLAVICRCFLELDEAETAAVLGWPRGTVKSRLSRALVVLRARVGDLDGRYPGA